MFLKRFPFPCQMKIFWCADMSLKEYQQMASLRMNFPMLEGSALLYTSIGLAGEAGEACNEIKKLYRDDGGTLTETRRLALISELGDVLWYTTMLADAIGSDLQTVAKGNLSKLLKRYGKLGVYIFHALGVFCFRYQKISLTNL